MPPSATYRFIPIAPEVVPAPVNLSEISFARPLAGGSVSGTLEVTWTAKTPICIGDQGPRGRGGENDPILPIEIDGRACLPGSTLRGMVRAVLEIATFSHLGRINAHRHHGVREFEGLGPHHAIRPQDLRAGWLYFDNGNWLLRPTRDGFRLVSIENILEHLPDASRPSAHDWRLMETYQKYKCLEDASLPALRTQDPVVAEDLPMRREPRVAAIQDVRSKPGRFILVCTGPFQIPPASDGLPTTGKPKRYEALFSTPDLGKAFVIPQAYVNLFHRMHSDPCRLGGNPRGAWRTWLRAKNWTGKIEGFEENGEDGEIPRIMRQARFGIPIFWKGDPPDQAQLDNPPPAGRQSFWFSLSRVMRVPFAFSVGQVAQAIYSPQAEADYLVPRLADESATLDFARAMFGDIDDANIASAEMPEAPGARPSARALRGRVAFGFAWTPEGSPLQLGLKHDGVFAQPRESFWPVYLRDRNDYRLTRSYSSPNAVPAGRKRTFARREGLPSKEWARGNEKADTLTYLKFLPPGTPFVGYIRVMNLHPIELGALLYSLTFGDSRAEHWHQAGRAKGLGYGCLEPSVRWAKSPRLVGVADLGEVGNPATVAPWVAKFKCYMDEQLGRPFDGDPTILALRRMADPDTAAKLGKNLSVPTLDDCREMRDKAKPAQDGQADAEYPFDPI